MFFRYLQVRHALQSGLESVTLVDMTFGEDPKKLISLLYTQLLTPKATTHAYQLKSNWETDLGEIEDEEWGNILETSKKVSPKLSDWLTHRYILHKSYITPSRLYKYKLDADSTCPRCGDTNSTFYHLIWSCPPIHHYWSQVIKFLHDHMGSPLMRCPRQCKLGLLPLPEEEKYLTIFLQETLFIARMQITQLWLRTISPTVQQWKRAVNLTLPYKKVLYSHRGCPDKFNKMGWTIPPPV